MSKFAAACIFLMLALLIAIYVHRRFAGPGGVDTLELTPKSSDVTDTVPVWAYPRRELTPGAVDPTVTQSNIQDTICVPGYSKAIRSSAHASRELRTEVFHEYGVSSQDGHVLDHLVPIELGGCVSCIENLWPASLTIRGSVLGKRIALKTIYIALSAQNRSALHRRKQKSRRTGLSFFRK